MKPALLRNSLLAASALLLSAPEALPIIVRHDRVDALYVVSGDRYAAVCRVGGIGEGTLIAPRWVLTAAHVAEGVGPFRRYVEFGAERYVVEKVIPHPGWVKDGERGGRDFALLKLEREVRGVTPVRLYDRGDEAGKVVTFVGRGLTGTGLTGPLREGKRALRAATNRVESADEASIRMVFDTPPGGTDLEGISGPGDSGGPALLEEGGRLYTLGVSSTNSGAGEEHCKYGTTETYARVSTGRKWIDEAIKTDAPASLAWSPLAEVGAGRGLPDTPAAKVAAAYFAAFNSGQEAAILKFNEEYRSESYLKNVSREQQARQSRSLMDRVGTLDVVAYTQAGPQKLGVLTYSKKTGNWQGFIFELEAAAPHKLGAIGLSMVEPPANIAVPK